MIRISCAFDLATRLAGTLFLIAIPITLSKVIRPTEEVIRNEYVRRKLLQTGDRELVEDSWRDDYWGWGPNHDGKNMLGRLWMEIREELREHNLLV